MKTGLIRTVLNTSVFRPFRRIPVLFGRYLRSGPVQTAMGFHKKNCYLQHLFTIVEPSSTREILLDLEAWARCHPIVASWVFFSSSLSLFFLAFLVWVSKQNVTRKTQGTKFKMTSTFFTPTHFLLLTKRFFLTNYYLTKVIKGRTNQRGLSATSLPFTILFFFTTQKSYYGFLFFFIE